MTRSPKHYLHIATLAVTVLSIVSAQTVTVDTRSLETGRCQNSFIKHRLPHTTHAHGAEVTYYDSNGAGVAVNDLDNDGDLDIVLAQLKGQNSILWNEGKLIFRQESLSHGNSRSVATVDVNGDGLMDIVFTQSTGSLAYWQQTGAGFALSPLRGVTYPAYSMVWFDKDADGDLDLVTASYDSLLAKEMKDSFLFSQGAGVIYYEQVAGRFEASRLADTAQALALVLFDMNDDGKQDLIVGNDFEVPDYSFENTAEGWLEANPFSRTTRNTMSFASADIDNNGTTELFATDMKPDFSDTAALAAWMPLMQKSYERKTQAASQVEENFLYSRHANTSSSDNSGFDNIGYDLGIDATGWSWSGKFGDLNNDGLLDLYVVNGMIAKEVFAHLPEYELIEENKAFQQTARGFVPAPEWQLNALESGRGMTIADLDNDGDLDIVINNLESPASLFENQLCGGASLELELYDSSSANTRALGATVVLETSAGNLTREVMASSGYLSGDTIRLHFGVVSDAELTGLTIQWPTGEDTWLDTVEANTLLVVRRATP